MRGKSWTTLELKAASNLWKSGKTIEEIAATLGRKREGVKHQTQAHRDYFPRRKQERMSNASTVTMKFQVTEFVYAAVVEEALARGISINMLVRETLRDRFVRKLWKLPESTSTARVRPLRNSEA